MQPMIVIVEHDHSNREFLETFLKFEGFRVLTAETSDTALDLVQEHRPVLVLLDAHLPGTCSLELHTRLKNDQAIADIPVIAMTTHIMPSQQQSLHDAGFAACIYKPIDISQLRIYINYYAWQNSERSPHQ